MKQLKKLIKKIFMLDKGQAKLIKEYDLKAESMTPPVSEDIDNDGEIETIFTNAKGEIFVFSENFKLKWKYKVKEQISQQESMFLDEEISNSINSAPLITSVKSNDKKIIIFGTEYGSIYALNHLGQKLWKFETQSPIRGGINSFELEDKKGEGIIFGSKNKYLYILSKEGKLLRKFLNESDIESTPMMIKNEIIFGDNEGKIKSLLLNGKIKWSFKAKDKIVSKPITAKLYDGTNVLLITSVDNFLYCLSEDGELIWRFETKGPMYTEPSVLDINNDSLDEIIFGSTDGNVYVLTMQGNLLWKFETDFWVMGKPITKKTKQGGPIEIVVGSYDNNVYVLTGKGLYIIEYIPGVSGIVAQNGNYSDIPSNAPGELIGDKVWEYGTGGLVVGCSTIKNTIIVQTKEGRALWLNYVEE